MKSENNTLTNTSIEDIGNDHLFTSLETPMIANAFTKSDTEKKEIIAFHFTEIMKALDLDLTDDSLKGTPEDMRSKLRMVVCPYADSAISGQ